MGKMKSLLNFFVTIEDQQGEANIPEEAASADTDEAAKAARARAESGPVGREPDKMRRVRDMGLDPYAGSIDEEALAATEINLDDDDAGQAFDEIYRAAKLPGREGPEFTIYKVARLLQSEHLQELSDRARRASVLVALEANNVTLQSVLQDAVSRDKALDQYDAMLRREVKELSDMVEMRNAEIQAEIEEFIEMKREEMAENNERVNQARLMYETWAKKKEIEEDQLFRSVSVFVEENPITRGMGEWPETQQSTQNLTSKSSTPEAVGATGSASFSVAEPKPGHTPQAPANTQPDASPSPDESAKWDAEFAALEDEFGSS